MIYAALWGKGRLALIDTLHMEIAGYREIDARIPASCAFYGKNMEKLAVVTATYGMGENYSEYDGHTLSYDVGTHGFAPHLFGRK